MSDTGRGMRLRLGAFVLLALVLLGALIVMFGSLPSLFRRTTAYTVRFTDAPGLAPGAPVRRSGVRIGEVRSISLDEERGIVRVTLLIDSPYRLRRSEQATLVAGILGSDASIDFVPKQAEGGEPIDRDPFEPGAELVGVRAATVNTLLRGAGEVLPNTQETLNDIRKSIQRLERFVARAERTIPLAEETLREYRELAKSARGVVPEAQKALSEVREFAKAYREAAPDLTRAVEEFRQLARDARTALPELLKTNAAILDAVKSARELFPTVESALDEVRELARDVRKVTADVQKLIPTVKANLDDIGSAARQAQRLVENLDRVVLENKDEFKAAVERLSKSLDQAVKLLSDDNVRRFNAALTNIATASDQLPSITKNMDDVMQQARITVRQLNETLKRVDESLKDVSKLTKPLGDRAADLSRNADESLSRLNSILGDVQALMRAIDKSDGTLRKLLTDPSIYNNLDRALIAAGKLLPGIERILKDVEVFTDKIARHPEILGVRGAVNPGGSGGTGLKGPPTPPLNPGR
jgi:ABC-type transporter Mla subunit MlaD